MYVRGCLGVKALSAAARLESYQYMHDLLWGKEFLVLKSVPFGDEGELEYLGVEEAYQSLDLGSPTNERPSAAIIGQPGIGKPVFLFYVLLHWLRKRLPTALQLDNTFVLFLPDGADLYPGTVLLTNAGAGARTPCGAFMAAAKKGNARIIQATSPYQGSWRDWQAQCQVSLYVL
ncbi:hypothetical protein EDB92DRAFT_1870169 [Lactarius akahatsu]|uniref:Uncharacterized protein n=1 Tax=Lactarius akahatsu TaxID=416441 RepID=A0AAD4LEL4_9AGAM|nr:hypothetical protein EDB92DRAFT_1870169 [Lactarius akahatsu]